MRILYILLTLLVFYWLFYFLFKTIFSVRRFLGRQESKYRETMVDGDYGDYEDLNQDVFDDEDIMDEFEEEVDRLQDIVDAEFQDIVDAEFEEEERR